MASGRRSASSSSGATSPDGFYWTCRHIYDATFGEARDRIIQAHFDAAEALANKGRCPTFTSTFVNDITNSRQISCVR